MSNAEEGIARVQAKAAQGQTAESDGLGKVHKWNIAYLDERILIYLLALAFMGLLAVWLTASSPIILYGSLAVVILIILLWGVVRIKVIEQTREQRARQAEESQRK